MAFVDQEQLKAAEDRLRSESVEGAEATGEYGARCRAVEHVLGFNRWIADEIARGTSASDLIQAATTILANDLSSVVATTAGAGKAIPLMEHVLLGFRREAFGAVIFTMNEGIPVVVHPGKVS